MFNPSVDSVSDSFLNLEQDAWNEMFSVLDERFGFKLNPTPEAAKDFQQFFRKHFKEAIDNLK